MIEWEKQKKKRNELGNSWSWHWREQDTGRYFPHELSSQSSFKFPFFFPVFLCVFQGKEILHTLFHLIRERKPYISLFPISLSKKVCLNGWRFSSQKSEERFQVHWKTSCCCTFPRLTLFIPLSLQYFMTYLSLSSSNLYSYMKNKYNEYQHQLLNQKTTVMVQSYSIFHKKTKISLWLNLLISLLKQFLFSLGVR